MRMSSGPDLICSPRVMTVMKFAPLCSTASALMHHQQPEFPRRTHSGSAGRTQRMPEATLKLLQGGNNPNIRGIGVQRQVSLRRKMKELTDGSKGLSGSSKGGKADWVPGDGAESFLQMHRVESPRSDAGLGMNW